MKLVKADEILPPTILADTRPSTADIALYSTRPTGSTPYTLLDYFPKDFLLFIDESHVTLPQVRGMYGGDRSRKENLVEYGFRLPSALDNRPLNFDEFQDKLNQIVYVSATPGNESDYPPIQSKPE